MTGQQWSSVWGVVRSSWPVPYLAEDSVKAEWGLAFVDEDPRLVVDAVRVYAKRSDRPTLAGLMVVFAERMQDHLRQKRIEALPPPPPEAEPTKAGMPDFAAQYAALDPVERDAIEYQIQNRYPAAYLGRNTPGPLQWAWQCLVIACAEKGIDPHTNGYKGSTTLSAREAEEAHYQTRLDLAQQQLMHEQGCPRCQSYAAPALGKERRGSPCYVGLRYFEPYYQAGVARP
jgi:hypothetical protein